MFNRHVFLTVKRRLPLRRRSPYNIYLVFFSLSGVVFLLALAPVFYLLGQPLLGKSALALAGAMTVNLGLWRLGMSGFWGQTIFEGLMIIALVFCAWWTGGVASPILVPSATSKRWACWEHPRSSTSTRPIRMTDRERLRRFGPRPH